MTVPERTDLNKRIAEDVEPIPENCLKGNGLGSIFPNPSFWQFNFRESKWIPRDVTRDPSLTLMLMGKMIQDVGLHIWTKDGQAHIGYENSKYFGQGPFIASTIGEAMCLAYAKMRNLR